MAVACATGETGGVRRAKGAGDRQGSARNGRQGQAESGAARGDDTVGHRARDPAGL